MIKIKFMPRFWSNTFVVIGLLLLIAGCASDGCLHSRGTEMVEERDVTSSFDSVVLDGEMNLYITQSYRPRLLLKGGSNVLPWISTSLSGNTLTIADQNGCSFLRDLGFVADIYLTVTDLSYISILSSGSVVSTDTLHLENLSVDYVDGAGLVDLKLKSVGVKCQVFNGASEVRLAGEAQHVHLYGAGFGPLDASGLSARYVFAAQHGSNMMKVRPADEGTLLVELHSNGHIGYFGNPQSITVKQIGDGRLIKL